MFIYGKGAFSSFLKETSLLYLKSVACGLGGGTQTSSCMMKKTIVLITTGVALGGAALAALTVTDATTPLPWGAGVNIIVGNAAEGTATVDGDFDAEVNYATVGAYSGGDGLLTVSGSGSTFTLHGGLRVGYNTGAGLVVVSNNAVMNSDYYTSLGHVENSSGTLIVDNATFNSSANYLHVGTVGDGKMYVRKGGVVTVAGDSNISRSNGSYGYVQISNSGSVWRVTGDLEVGRLDDAALLIYDNSLVKVDGALRIDATEGGVNEAYIRMRSGGSLALADAAGTGHDSLADFLVLVDGDDDIRYWDGDDYDDIIYAVEGVDYTLAAGTGDLTGYAVLTVGAVAPVPPPAGFLFALRGPPDVDLYIAPLALGSGSGADAENAAAYTNQFFWSTVQDTLVSDPVTVSLLDGNYGAKFALDSIGNERNMLILSGESSSGVVFNAERRTLFSLRGCQNMLLENLNFTGPGIGYALKITKEDGGTVSSNITVRNCNWYDMEDIYYGACGVHYGSHHVDFENCTFKRIGFDGHAHMMYHSYDADHVRALNCHFEDCAGAYVRFRDRSDYGEVSGCTFVSTQTYVNRHASQELFIEIPVFNDVNPGNETFGRNFTFTSNTFLFHAAEPAIRYGIRYTHVGYDPPGMNYLMTAAEGAILEGSDPAAKKTLLRDNCGIDFDAIVIDGNTWANEIRRIVFASSTSWGAVSKGWDGEADVSDIVFGF